MPSHGSTTPMALTRSKARRSRPSKRSVNSSPTLTDPLARVFAQHRNDLPTPYRRYAMGPVWRNEKPGPGRFRQFYQCDADTVGSASMAADAEICTMLSDTLEKVGIARGDYIVRVNNRKVLDGVLEAMGVSDAGQQADVLRTI